MSDQPAASRAQCALQQMREERRQFLRIIEALGSGRAEAGHDPATHEQLAAITDRITALEERVLALETRRPPAA